MYPDETVLVTKNDGGRCSSPPGWSCNQYSHHLSVIPSVSIIYAFLCRLFLCQRSFCPPCFLLRHELTRPAHLFCNFLPHSVRQGCLLLAALTVLFPSPARHLFDNNDICLPCNEKAHFGQNMCLRHWKPDILYSSPAQYLTNCQEELAPVLI